MINKNSPFTFMNNSYSNDISNGTTHVMPLTSNRNPYNSLNKEQVNNKFASSYKDSLAYKLLLKKFSSGVTLPELFSIATVISSNILSGINKPGRNEQRSLPLLIKWYEKNWDLVYPILPFVQLRDKDDKIICERREFIEKCLNY